MRRQVRIWMAASLCVALAGLTATAQDKANATGTWKWTIKFGDRSFEQTAKLKQEGDKLTGVLVGRNNRETPIEQGAVKGDEVSFQVEREVQGQKFTTKFKGKVSGDTLKGKMDTNFGGEDRSIDWDAKRDKDAK